MEKIIYNEVLRNFLSNNHLYPIDKKSQWRCIEIEHPTGGVSKETYKEREKIFKGKIIEGFKKSFNYDIENSGGIYIYKLKDGRIIYTGKGKKIIDRILSHYHESFKFEEKQPLWPNFFNQFKGTLELYIFEINDIKDMGDKNSMKIINNNIDAYRKIIEQAIELVEPSIFKTFVETYIGQGGSMKTREFKWTPDHTKKLIELINK